MTKRDKHTAYTRTPLHGFLGEIVYKIGGSRREYLIISSNLNFIKYIFSNQFNLYQMSNTYNIGLTTGPIHLAVDITTVGPAATRASVLTVGSNSPGIPVAHSADATGDISGRPIGGGASLKGTRLTIFTMVALTGEDPGSRAIEAAAVQGKYELSGGDEDVKSFNNPVKSYQDPNVFVISVIDLL